VDEMIDCALAKDFVVIYTGKGVFRGVMEIPRDFLIAAATERKDVNLLERLKYRYY
jgi:hypothetical protein